MKPGYYRVRVDCWYKPIGNGGNASTRGRVIRWFIVEASNGDAAMSAGTVAGEKATPFGRKLLKVEPREAFGPLKFPLEVPYSIKSAKDQRPASSHGATK